jgi:hypothetical protein
VSIKRRSLSQFQLVSQFKVVMVAMHPGHVATLPIEVNLVPKRFDEHGHLIPAPTAEQLSELFQACLGSSDVDRWLEFLDGHHLLVFGGCHTTQSLREVGVLLKATTHKFAENVVQRVNNPDVRVFVGMTMEEMMAVRARTCAMT